MLLLQSHCEGQSKQTNTNLERELRNEIALLRFSQLLAMTLRDKNSN